MKVVIVDDEPAARRLLRECCAREADIQVIGEFSDGQTALQALTANPPDVVLLDIHMDGLTGLQVARSLPAANMPLVIFATAYDQHAVEAFELNAVDYLLKPFDDTRVHAALERAKRLLSSQDAPQRYAALAALLADLGRRPETGLPPARVLGERDGRMHMLEVSAIELVEADRNYVTLTCGRERYHVRSTMAQAEAALATQPLLRISRSCILNMRHVAQVSRTPRGDFILVMQGGTTVTSSEGYRERVRDYLRSFRVGGDP